MKTRIILIALGTLAISMTYYFVDYQPEQEIARQNKICEKAYDAIERFASEPNILTKHDAKVALDEADEQGIGRERYELLRAYMSNIDGCLTVRAYLSRSVAAKKVLDASCVALSGSQMSAVRSMFSSTGLE